MALDEIFNERSLNHERLQEEEQRLKKVVGILMLMTMIAWGAINIFETGINLNILVGLAFSFIIVPPMVGFFLTVVVALLPYGGFSYSKRFFRYFLIVLMLLYILCVVFAFITIGSDFNLIPIDKT